MVTRRLIFTKLVFLVLAVEENKSTIYEIDPQILSRRRTFSIDWSLNGNDVLNPKKEHLEGTIFDENFIIYIADDSGNTALILQE